MKKLNKKIKIVNKRTQNKVKIKNAKYQQIIHENDYINK